MRPARVVSTPFPASVTECRREIEMSPGVQSSDDTPVGGDTMSDYCIL